MMVFIRTTPLPNCRHCKKPMGYYIPFLDDDKHSHPECEGKAMANDILREFRKGLGLSEKAEKPTKRGREKYTKGYYDGVPCTCKDNCTDACDGKCGCEACHNAYQDDLSCDFE